jgi:CO/xanthine dehydrogenase Mo-binding subunit
LAPPKEAVGSFVACGFWFNGGGESSASVQVNEDGTVIIATGSPDIGGSRASMALMAAETLEIDYHQIRSIVADTSSVGYTHVTGGSRVTFATGMAIVEASKKILDELRGRAAMIWDVDVEGVIWEDGQAKPASSNVGDFPPLSFKELAAKKALTGGPITAAASVGPRFLDPVLRCRGRPRDRQGDDPALCRGPRCRLREGQIQGGVAQGIGWALNEEYIYDRNGRLDNASFLDYRVPVASDMPMIEPILVERPNPAHPYGAKGVGKVNIVPPMAAIANAIDSAIHETAYFSRCEIFFIPKLDEPSYSVALRKFAGR